MGEGDPARTLTHRLVRLLARAPLLAPLRWCQQLASPPEAQGPVRVQEDGERSGASRGSAASRSEGVGKVGRSLRPPGTPQTRPPPAPLSHGSCGPSHHTGSRLRAPAGERRQCRPIRSLANRGSPHLGGVRRRRATRKDSTAARLPVNDSPAQPITKGEMTSSLREVWNWWSSGQKVGGRRGRAGGGVCGLKRP